MPWTSKSTPERWAIGNRDGDDGAIDAGRSGEFESMGAGAGTVAASWEEAEGGGLVLGRMREG